MARRNAINPWALAMLVAVVAALCVLVGSALPAEIAGPTQVEPYKLIDHKLSGSWESAIWEVEPSAGVDLRTTDNGKAVLWVAPPGRYTLRVVLVDFTRKKLAQDKLAVAIGNPQPGPGPTPEPGPIGKLTWVLVVEETSATTREQSAWIHEPAWRQQCASRGISYRVLDPDQRALVPPAFARWIDVAGAKLPAVVLVDDAGQYRVEPVNGPIAPILARAGGVR